MKGKLFILNAIIILIIAIVIGIGFSCSTPVDNSDDGGGGGGGEGTSSVSNSSDASSSTSSEASSEATSSQIYYPDADLSSEWIAYNDCVGSTGGASNITYCNYNTNTSDYLINFAAGLDTTIFIDIIGDNLAPWDISGVGKQGMSLAGTDAYNTFNGIMNLNEIASYATSSNWYFQVTFTGLDPAKKYAFVSTANRDEVNYDGSGSSSRWTKFTILGADTYRNISSNGIVTVSEDVLKMNTGYNSVNGYVIAWTDITASDGSFTIRSENVGTDGPGELYKSYGLQGFKFIQITD